MNNNDFAQQIQTNWLDTNGLIKAQPDWQTSGNGILYSCVANFLANTNIVKLTDIGRCKKKVGLYMRNPQNTFGQEEFDDYLGLAILFLITRSTDSAKEVCWYGCGFYLNVPFNWSDFGKSFLWRFPQVWVLMWSAAYPWLKWPLYPFMRLIGLFMKLDPTDLGGVQLSWLYFEGMNLLGFNTKQLAIARSMIPLAFKSYYHPSHPFIKFVEDKYLQK